MNDYKKEVIDPGDEVSRLAKTVCFNSHGNCQAVVVVPHAPGNFRGPVGWLWQKGLLGRMAEYNYRPHGGVDWQLMEEIENDGAGGKPQFFTLVGTTDVFYNLGWEIIAMTADDFARSGRLPCIMANELQVKKATKANLPLIRSMFNGLESALRESNLVNITGETAIMKNSIAAFCDTDEDGQLILTWGATCIGLADKDLLFNPKNIKPNMPIVGFLENGYRCNGGGAFTKLLLKKYGDVKTIRQDPQAMDFVRKLTIPSISYAKTICRIIGWQENGEVGDPLAQVIAAAHITGGGIWGKLGEILPSGVGAHLGNMPPLTEVLREAQWMSGEFSSSDDRFRDEDMYDTFHGGLGMALVAPSDDEANKIMTEAAKDGIKSQVVGYTTYTSRLKIVSRGLFRQGKLLTAPEPD